MMPDKRETILKMFQLRTARRGRAGLVSHGLTAEAHVNTEGQTSKRVALLSCTSFCNPATETRTERQNITFRPANSPVATRETAAAATATCTAATACGLTTESGDNGLHFVRAGAIGSGNGHGDVQPGGVEHGKEQ